jgi:hypothetical protein
VINKITGKKKEQTGGVGNDEDEEAEEEVFEEVEEVEDENTQTNEIEIDQKTNQPVAYSEDYLTMFHLYNIISLYTNVPDIINAITNIKNKDKQIHSQIKLNNSLYDVLVTIRKLSQKRHLNYYGSDGQNMYLSTTGIMKVAQFIKEQEILKELGKVAEKKVKLTSEEKKQIRAANKEKAKRAKAQKLGDDTSSVASVESGISGASGASVKSGTSGTTVAALRIPRSASESFADSAAARAASAAAAARAARAAPITQAPESNA